MKYIIIMILSLLISSIPDINTDNITLNYLVRQPKVQSDKPPLLIMLHGMGSNEKDLFNFANQMDERFLVISAQAPYRLGENSFGWYEVSFPNGKPQINDVQAEKSSEMLIHFIDQIVEKHKANPEKVYLMGFSQGAIMSFSVGLTRPDKVSGMACFSGRILQKTKENISPNKKLKALDVLLVHSTDDNILNYQYALESQKVLDRNGIKTQFITDEVGHSISQASLGKFKAWLKSK
tara:strand:- start:45 stop:752 length:708 start_codon:yes stop_codon:yes gene_type:complete